jgi:ABC-type spermidine/putrescine transport system permease subunit II
MFSFIYVSMMSPDIACGISLLIFFIMLGFP